MEWSFRKNKKNKKAPSPIVKTPPEPDRYPAPGVFYLRKGFLKGSSYEMVRSFVYFG